MSRARHDLSIKMVGLIWLPVCLWPCIQIAILWSEKSYLHLTLAPHSLGSGVFEQKVPSLAPTMAMHCKALVVGHTWVTVAYLPMSHLAGQCHTWQVNVTPGRSMSHLAGQCHTWQVNVTPGRSMSHLAGQFTYYYILLFWLFVCKYSGIHIKHGTVLCLDKIYCMLLSKQCLDKAEYMPFVINAVLGQTICCYQKECLDKAYAVINTNFNSAWTKCAAVNNNEMSIALNLSSQNILLID